MREFGTREESTEYRERPGAYGIAIHDGQLLVEKARLGWFLPGGGVEEGESLEEALVREMREESGYDLASWKPLESVIEYRNGPEKDWWIKKISHFFVVEVGKRYEPTYDDGHRYPVEWTPLADALERLFLEAHRWALQEAVTMQAVPPRLRYTGAHE